MREQAEIKSREPSSRSIGEVWAVNWWCGWLRVVEELKRVRARITDAAGFKCGFNPMHDQEQGAGTRFDKRGLAPTAFRLQRVGDRSEQRLAAACCSGLAGDGHNGNSRHHAKSRG